MSDLECIRLQNQQFKALSYIYLEEFHPTKDSTPHKFTILVKPYSGNQEQFQINLVFEFTQSYPKSPLKYQLQPVTGLTRDNIISIQKNIEDILYQNRNRPIVYDVVEQIRYWIQEYLVEGKAYQQTDDYEESLKKKQQTFERPRFAAFTPVTAESFMNWKRQFEAEQRNKKMAIKKQGETKISGKQWFLGKKDVSDEEDDQDDDEDYEGEQQEQNAQQEMQKIQIPRDDVQDNDLF